MDEEISLSQHVHSQLSTLVDESPLEKKLALARVLRPFLSQLDAYVELGPESQAQLPSLEWNRHFRKAYSLFMWIRPELSNEQLHPSAAESPSHSQQRSTTARRILYRFSTSPDDPSGVGICVTVGDWKAIPDPEHGSYNLHTTLTAFSLPYLPFFTGPPPTTNAAHGNKAAKQKQQNAPPAHASLLTVPLKLPANTWSLIGMTHVFPYLKRPQWTLTVNGQVQGTGELAYPVLDGNAHMTHNTLLHRVADGGASYSSNNKPDDKKSASELNDPAQHIRYWMQWQVASMALHPDVISPSLQALLAEAGPTLSLQHYGRILVPLPPVANWSKGSSLEGGPSVGIAISQSLELQRLLSRAVVFVSATQAKMLQSRIIIPMVYLPGETDATPKVGLLQPAVPSAAEIEDVALHFFGPCHVVHALSEYLLQCDDGRLDTQLFSCSKHFSVVLQEQSMLERFVLPFFLAQIPPGHGLDMQAVLYQKSLTHLYYLYANDGEWAYTLIQLLSTSIENGGGRAQEQVLQAGLIHILASTLRRSLVRSQRLKSTTFDTHNQFIEKGAFAMESQVENSNSCPKTIPIQIAQACAELVAVCCGPVAQHWEQLSMAMQIRRSSDLALTVVFGLGLDLDLWGKDVVAAGHVIGAVASRYGGLDVMYGNILRHQIPVQSLLDMIRIRMETLVEEGTQVADYFSSLLQAMLLSSLCNRKVISHAEHDIAACLGALSDCALGTVGAHVILTSLAQILEWCNTVPAQDHDSKMASEENRYQVAARLGRNLLMGQYHDVIAPMLLSRTVFCGERIMSSSTSESSPRLWHHHWRLALMLFSWVTSISGPEGHIAAKSTGSLLFASSLAGSLKGCLVSDTERDHYVISSLFLPTPSIALTIGTADRLGESSSWTYTDLLSNRLQVMMPLLPGLVVSLVCHPADVNAATTISSDSIEALTEILAAVTAAFRRVFGGLAYNAMSHVRRNHQNKGRNKAIHSAIVKAAKDYVPHLLTVAMLLESHIHVRSHGMENEKTVILKSPKPTGDRQRSDSDVSWVEVSSIHDISSADDQMVVDPALETTEPKSDTEVLVSKLSACQKLVLRTLTDLVINAMKLGGGEASTVVWRCVVGVLNESVHYGAISTLSNKEHKEAEDASTNMNTDTVTHDNVKKEIKKTPKQLSVSGTDDQIIAQNILCRLAAVVLTKAQKREYEWELWNPDICGAISRLVNLVEEKELLLKPLGHAIVGKQGEDGTELDDDKNYPGYSRDQVLLICALTDVMAYGRDMTGWCQLILPKLPTPNMSPSVTSGYGAGNDYQLTTLSKPYDDDTSLHESADFTLPTSDGGRIYFAPPESPAASSKVMLPVLQPMLRVLLECVGNVRSSTEIAIPHDVPAIASPRGGPSKGATISFSTDFLLERIITELRQTLTAAIVGLSFPNSRDVALNGLASLRRAIAYHRNANDDAGVQACSALIVSIVEEIWARYEGERRRREKALFDAYDDDVDPPQRSEQHFLRSEAESSREVERMILGGDLIPARAAKPSNEAAVEEITFAGQDGTAAIAKYPVQNKQRSGSEDFILFHEAFVESSHQKGSSANEGEARKMGYNHYQGLWSTLEECSVLMNASRENSQSQPKMHADMLLALMMPFLDKWDEIAARDAAESELVELFDANVNLGGSDEQDVEKSGIQIFGSETAADAMSSFIEISSSEKSRLNEMIASFLPSRRYSCTAYAERYCWARYMEIASDGTEDSVENLWERGIADGNRDIRSRLISMPCSPQFKRFIPSYLDHASGMDEDDRENTVTAGDEGAKHRPSASPSEIGTLTKSLLEAGNIEIVDITKKEMSEDDLLDNIMGADAESLLDAMDDDMLGDGSLGFPTRDESTEHETVENFDKSEDGDAATADSALTETTSSDDPSQQHDDFNGRTVDKSHPTSFHHNIASTAFSHPPDNSASILSLMHSSAAADMIEQHFDNSLHVKAEGSRKCTILLSATHLILEYDSDAEGLFEGELLAVQEEAERQRMAEDVRSGPDNGDEKKEDRIQIQLERRQRETAALRPKSIRWNLSELSHVYLRRYRLRDSAIEMFFIPSGGSSFGGFGLYSPGTSLFIDFGAGHEGNIRRDDAAHSIMRRAPPQTIKQWPDKSGQFLHEQLSRLTLGWVDGRITNFDYLLHLNMLAGRSYNDLCQYPVMPWVLSNYTAEEIPDLSDRANFRDLTKPMGALNPERLEEFIDRFETFSDATIPPFMYGSHYSTSAGVVLHFLVRMHPFAGLHRQLQGGHFDVADRLFASVPRTWDMCTGCSAAEVKELTPEWYCNPAFLKNSNSFKLGTSQDGEVLGNVTLPPWAHGSPEKFIEVMRNALESDICSEMLPDWIDLVFGRKQQGPESIKAHNVFFYLTYYGSVDVASIEDESLRTATELQIAHFGQCPMQLFMRPHVHRVQRMRNYRKLSFYQMLSAYTQGAGPNTETWQKDGSSTALVNLNSGRKIDGTQRLFGEPLFLPFFSAPISHWVHLDAPPPGPHAALIAVRLAGIDRCLAVDAQGIFHSFRWAWKPEPTPLDEGQSVLGDAQLGPIDKGYFVAQRELHRFRTVPRLPHIPAKRSSDSKATIPAVAISKTLFAGRSVLLVLSDGDGRGALSMQLVDPAKGNVRGEAMVPAVHSSRITCIAMDPIGTAAGHGGVGGELAILGSADGGATLWRFMSSHYLPLRPRVRMTGHGGSNVHAVALSSAIHICASVSANRCCIFSVGNGAMIRSFPPPQGSLDLPTSEGVKSRTIFADTPALALSVQGFVVTVCQTTVVSEDVPSLNRSVITLHLFSLEGVSLGSKAMESWRGVPHNIACTPDGTAITVCSGRGVTIHRLSAITPLEFIDEWHITETDELDENVPAAWDVDFGPSLMRPIVAAAACSSGSLRLHALPGITQWSERHKKSSMTSAVGHALAKPAQRIKTAVGKGLGLGSKFVGMGKDIGREVSSDVKERGVGGFLTGAIFRKNQK